MKEPRALVKNAADAEQVAKGAAREDLEQQMAVEDLRTVLATAAGRRFVWAELVRARVHELSFASDPHVTAFNEGRRSFGNELLARIMDATPERYLEMMREAQLRTSHKAGRNPDGNTSSDA